MPIEELWAVQGTRRAREIEAANAQRGFGGNLKAGFGETAAASAYRFISQEGAANLEENPIPADAPLRDKVVGTVNAYTKPLFSTERAGGDEDYSDQYETLTRGIPSQFHEDILSQPNAEAAQRARMRIAGDLERARVSGMQQGLSSNLAVIAGGIVDLDLPLIAVTGGGYKAADIARRTVQASRKLGISPRGALRLSSAAVGANAGLQSGLIAGTAEAYVRETADWTTVAETALQSMLLGAGLNTALRGDAQLGIRAAQDELHARMRRDDPSLYADAAPDPASAERLSPNDAGPVLFTEEGAEELGSTVGARQVQAIPGVTLTPVSGVSDAVADISAMADNWRFDSGWKDWKIADDDEWWSRVALSDAFNITTNNWRTLYRSDSSVLNWMLGNVYESPNGLGRGRWTAATGQEMYYRQISEAYVGPLQEAATDWSRRNGQQNVVGLPKQSGIQMFNREVLLEMNDRALGRSGVTRDPAVTKAADALDKAGEISVNIGKGRADQLSLDGFENLAPRSGYSPYVWRGQDVRRLEAEGVVTRNNIIDAMTTAYRTAGISATKDARLVAKAVVDRATAQADDINTNLISLLSGDGREWLETALESSGISKVEREGLLKRLTGEVEERGRESFAKARNDIDLNQRIQTSDGSDLRIVDLMNQDIHGTWQRYSRRLAGASALARVGITNRAHREQFIEAAQAQQRALGEPVVDGDMLRAMFSNFDGSAIQGWSNITGRIEQGVAPEAALAKRMTNLALLGKLGFAQLAESGATIAQAGFENWWRRGPGAAFDAQIRAGNRELLDDIAFLTGELGQDHRLFAEHLDLDDMNATDRGTWFQYAQGLSQRASYYQSYVSGFNIVRGFQQRVATSALTDKVFREIKSAIDEGRALDESFVRRARTDLGLEQGDLLDLEELIHNGTIEFSPEGFVNRINADQWDGRVADNFASAITRNMNQVVQRSMAGEQDAWLHTTVGSLLTHLKTFPLQAMQKQFIRNVRHMDTQAVATVLYGMVTAAVAIKVRDALDGRERDLAETAKTAFGYSNLTGWVPMAVDPFMTLMGMEDLRINQYGPHSDYTPATVTWANRAARLPGAAIDTLTGQADYYDRQSLKALPFANVLGLSRIMD